MNRSCRNLALLLSLVFAVAPRPCAAQTQSGAEPGVAILNVDADRPMGTINENVYGHFLEFINHSIVDGLYAEQVRGQGFEGKDFDEYWTAFGPAGAAAIADLPFEHGAKSLRIAAGAQPAGVRQGRVYVESGRDYDGSAWLKVESGSPRVSLRLLASDGGVIAETALAASGTSWQEAAFAFSSSRTDKQATLEISASGSGAVLVDFVSLARSDARRNGMLRPDLFASLKDLAPPFIRWPGGSFASTYKWRDAIGPRVSRIYTPNHYWGGYSDYYGFGTDEFLELTRQLGSDPMIVLPAPDTDTKSLEYAMDWVHYLVDPATTEWGRRRAANGHPEPYNIPYIQIDNEPMNNGFTAERYAEIVNVYGAELRRIAPNSLIVACGQKRSNDLAWSQKIIDLAGENFDILGMHNYEYEPDLYQSGVQRIGDYLKKVRDYVRRSAHPDIQLAVLEWNLSRAYDWRAGLHAAGNLILYETLGPEVTMTAPALLMRNTSDDPTWTAFIYHDHASWFPGGAYVPQKLFREHYAEVYLASTSGTFRDLPERGLFFDDISQMKPERWTPGTVDAIATASRDGRRIVLKAVNYAGVKNTLLTRLQGSQAPADATVKVYTVSAGLTDAASLEQPDRFQVIETTQSYGRDLTLELPPYSVVVAEIAAR